MKKDKSAGKYTFHFDDKGNRIGETMEFDEDRLYVIPLHPDEYSVIEDPASDWESRSAFASWESVLETETEADRVERVIRQSDEDTEETVNRAADDMVSDGPEEQKADEAAGWSWANDPELVLESLQMSNRKHSPTHWWKAALSVTAAIVIGAALGLFALNLLQQEDTTGNGAASGLAGAVESGADKPAMAVISSAGPVSVQNGTNIDARTYVLLQNGVFTTSEASDAALTSLKSQGLAAAMEIGDRKIVYAGFAPSQSEAQRLSKLLKDKKIDIYVKTVTLPAIERFKWAGSTPKSVAEFIRNGDKLIRMMSGVTIGHLEEAHPTPFDQATVKAIKDAYQQWIAAANGLKDGGAQAAAVVQTMTKAMGDAVAALDSYAAKPSADKLWDGQSAMMRYVIAQKQLQALISA